MKMVSELPNGVVSNYDVTNLEYCNIVYMCIKQAGCSEYQIPDNLKYLVNRVLSDVYRLSPSLYEDDWTKYCYITIKKGYIQDNSFPNRDGWHSDGFMSDQENFIWSDSIEVPTEVALGEFNVSDCHIKSLGEMEEQANHLSVAKLNINTLYDMKQHCIHRCTKNTSGRAILRTFIKITFSKELFNCVGNAWNYKLPHIVPNKIRNDELRNHTVK